MSSLWYVDTPSAIADHQQEFCQLALGFSDLCRQNRHEALSQLIGPAPSGGEWPIDIPFRILPGGRTQGVSTCGLAAMGFLRWGGFVVPEPQGIPIGTVMSYLYRYKNGLALGPGVFVMLQKPEHVCLIAGPSTSLGYPIVEGGRLEPGTGLQTVSTGWFKDSPRRIATINPWIAWRRTPKMFAYR